MTMTTKTNRFDFGPGYLRESDILQLLNKMPDYQTNMVRDLKNLLSLIRRGVRVKTDTRLYTHSLAVIAEREA